MSETQSLLETKSRGCIVHLDGGGHGLVLTVDRDGKVVGIEREQYRADDEGTAGPSD